MIQNIFHTAIYQPIYNALAALVSVVPGADVGIAIILLTILVKLILLPLSLVAVRSQMAMQEIDPELKRLRKDLKGKPEELARQTMALFKEKKVKPFASILLVFVQLPVIIGLYFVFLKEGSGAGFDPALLYAFISVPSTVSFNFLSFIDLTSASIVLAFLVAASQFVASSLVLPKPAAKTNDEGPSFQSDFARSMHIQMRYVFPVIIGIIAYVISAAIALYFLVSNLFAIGQELYVRRVRAQKQPTAGSV